MWTISPSMAGSIDAVAVAAFPSPPSILASSDTSTSLLRVTKVIVSGIDITVQMSYSGCNTYAGLWHTDPRKHIAANQDGVNMKQIVFEIAVLIRCRSVDERRVDGFLLPAL